MVGEYRDAVFGAEQHDVGWAHADLEPRLDPDSGLPRNFLETTVEEHLAIWRDAPLRLLSQSLHAALVASLHGRSLSELRARAAPKQAPALQRHIEEERARQNELCGLLGLSAGQAERIQRQMWTWDGLSLALCHGWRPFTAKDVPGRNCFGVHPDFADQPVFAESEARFRGEAVAMLAGEPSAVLALDLADFPVTWTELRELEATVGFAGQDRVCLQRLGARIREGDAAALVDGRCKLIGAQPQSCALVLRAGWQARPSPQRPP